ncbi:phosphoglycolate phosphatase [Acidimangrovimonas pyrenivorans]|uniref:Phosphoglycolate phosphatase n=1 Tax=Acidimangrovimonas pyrenivorans TaxID=2030798 RepID=A0ABV7AEX3_9RHOB
MTPVIFDLDGTLIDSAPDIHATANAVLAQEGLAPLTLTQIRSFIGNGVVVLMQKVMAAQGLPAEGAQYERMLAEFVERYEAAVNLTTLYPNVAESLAALRAEGRAIGLCTNKPVAPTRSVLAHFGLLDSFAAIVGGDSLPQRKPDPAPLRHVLAALGGGPAVYVGDSEVDAATAQAAALPFALFTEGYRKTPVDDLPHNESFDDFAALPGIVARLS